MKHTIKGLLAIVVVGGLLWAGWTRYYDFLTAGMQPTAGTKKLNEMQASGVPDFELIDLSGQPVRLSQFADRIVILNFWASWCDPCVEEFPSMVQLVEHFKGQVVLLAVSADKSISDIESFLKPYGGRLPKDVVVVWDQEKKIAEQYGTEALPESYILLKETKLFRKIAGSENWYSPGAVELFKQLVNLKPGEDATSLFGEKSSSER